MSLSKVVISGRVIRSPEKRFTPNTNVAVADFAVAVEIASRQEGSSQAYPIKVVAWRDLAERLTQELQKGDLVIVDGRLQISSYTTAEGQRRREVEIDALNVENISRQTGGGRVNPDPDAKRSLVKAGSRTNSELGNEELDAIFASEDEIPF